MGGECSHECVAREEMPNDDEWKSLTDKHVQEYQRDPIISPPEDDKIALPCPAKMQNFAGCNKFLCPVHCEVSEFSAWSECTKKCGGGTRAKTRSVVKRPKHGGTRCDALTETGPCNTFSCDVDCKLLDKARKEDWGPCVRGCRDSKDRILESPNKIPFKLASKPVVVAAKGKGKCPKKWSKARL